MNACRSAPASRSLPLTPISFEILLALLDEDRHGYAILQAVEARLRRRAAAADRHHLPGAGAAHGRRTDCGGGRGAGRSTSAGGPTESPREGRKIARAEAERLADQVAAARAHRLLPGQRK